MRSRTVILGLGALAAGISLAVSAAPNPATELTAASNHAILEQLPFADQQAFADAQRGFIAQLPDGKVLNADGSVAWDMSEYAFLNDESAPRRRDALSWSRRGCALRNAEHRGAQRVPSPPTPAPSCRCRTSRRLWGQA